MASTRNGVLRSARRAALGLFLLSAPALAGASPTYYVDAGVGDDARTPAQAASPLTPWRSIARAVSAGGLVGMTNKGVVLDGYTVVIGPGRYAESVESKRDGLPAAPVTIRAATRGTVTIETPAGRNGVFVSHHHHVIDGLVVTGGSVGIRLGAHDGGDGPVSGVVARFNVVHGNGNNGIQFANAQGGEASFNTVYDNGQSGINYSGNGAVLHDNRVYDNGTFGIYVRDGVDHQVWNNAATGNPNGDVKIVGSQIPPPGGRTFYVGTTGSDTRSDVEAQRPETPWKTFYRALQGMYPGDTLLILPGRYAARVESVRDGTAALPISVRAADPGSVTIQPPSGAGVYIGHHHHVVEGLVVRGAGIGLQMGPYKQTAGAVSGLVARHNEVSEGGIGIKFTNVVDAVAAHNVVWDNGKDGIAYVWGPDNVLVCPPGSGATIFNNLVYGNGGNLSGEYGITVGCGDRNAVASNTVHGNANGGIRMGVAGNVAVGGRVVDNVVVGSPVGVKEPAGSSYTGAVTLDFNNVWGNALNYGLGPTAKVGRNSISASPGFVDAVGADFRLGRVATGQAVDSPCIDRGSDTADAVGLAVLTAFVDKLPDSGRADLGYHGTALYPSDGRLAVEQAVLTLAGGSASLAFSATLTPGPDSDGIRPGLDFAQVVFGEVSLYLWTAGTRPSGGSQWTFTGASPCPPCAGGTVSATLQQHADGRVSVALLATGLGLSAVKLPTSVAVRIGDDYGSATVLLDGSLHVP